MVTLWWEEMHRKTCFTKATRKSIFILANLKRSPWPNDPGCLPYKSTLCYHLEWEASHFTGQMAFYKELSDGEPTSLTGQWLGVTPATWTDQTETSTSFLYLSSNLNCAACPLILLSFGDMREGFQLLERHCFSFYYFVLTSSFSWILPEVTGCRNSLFDQTFYYSFMFQELLVRLTSSLSCFNASIELKSVWLFLLIFRSSLSAVISSNHEGPLSRKVSMYSVFCTKPQGVS